MSLYHGIEITLVGAAVTASAVAAMRRYLPGIRAWLRPAIIGGTAAGSCSSGSACNGCAKGRQHAP